MRTHPFLPAILALVVTLGMPIDSAATDISNVQEPTAPPMPSVNGAGSGAIDLRSLRDPFRIIRTEGLDFMPKSELESAPLEDIKVVGILTGPSRTRALVRLPGGKNVVVGEGMRIGNEGAVIQKIGSSGLIVSGNRINVIGERELLTTEMPLIPENKKIEVKSTTTVTEGAPVFSSMANPPGSSEGSGGALNPAEPSIQASPKASLKPGALNAPSPESVKIQ